MISQNLGIALSTSVPSSSAWHLANSFALAHWRLAFMNASAYGRKLRVYEQHPPENLEKML